MELYQEMLAENICIIVRTEIIMIGCALVFYLIFFFLRKRFDTRVIRYLALLFAAYELVYGACYLVPRCWDLHEDAIVVVEDAKLFIESTQSHWHGSGWVYYPDGHTEDIYGLGFFEYADPNKHEYYGTVIYAKHSGQLLDIIQNEESESE